MDAANAVLQFLRSVSPGAEAEYYLREFRSGAPERFAAIAVDESTLAEATDAVAVDLRFLSELSLTPVVVLGLPESPGDVTGHADALMESLVREEVSAARHPADALQAVAAAVRAGTIPIVVLDPGGDRAAQLGRLLNHLQTQKLILLRMQGGLRRDGRRVSVLNLSEELSGIRREELADDDRFALSVSERLVFELVSHRLLVSIASPINLLHELFTLRGAGTLLRAGGRISRHEGMAGVDTARIAELLEASFGRAPTPELLGRDFSHVYVAQDYRGAALLQAHPQWGYLSKFAVTRRAQGEGIGRDLWQAVQRDYPRLLWRSRPENPITPWYEARCDGRMRAGKWTVYFRGLSPEDLPAAIAHAIGQPDDLKR